MKNLWQRVQVFIHSIRFRLVLWFSVILAVVLFAFSSFVYFNQLKDIRGETAFRMSRRLDDILRYVAIVDGKITLPDGLLASSDILIFASRDGQFLTAWGSVTNEEASEILVNAKPEEHAGRWSPPLDVWESKGGQHYSLILRPVRDVNGNEFLVIFASPYDSYGLIGRLTLTLLLGSLLTLAIAMGGGFWLADRAMRPVQVIAKAAREISDTDLSRRLNMKGRDELSELANTFDGMLARLDSAFQRQKQFVADASHELRTPLTIVNLETSRALAAKRSGPEYQRALNIIHSENSFMTRLVNELLVLARMDNGQLPLEKEPVDLSDVALEAVERLEALASRHRVRLETGDLPEAILPGNRQYLLQMVSNLIENGIKYAGGDDRFVRVETGLEAESVWLRVSDNGQGIPPDHVPHLFDRFFRADKARTRNENDDSPSGTGLGLSIVQSIAQAHGGDARFEHSDGMGSVFYVRLKKQV